MRALFSSFVLFALGSCSASPPREHAPPVRPPPPTAVRPAPKQTQQVVAVGRIRQPGRFLEKMAEYSGAAEPGASWVARSLPGAAEHGALDEPAHFALALLGIEGNPVAEPIGAIGFGVRSLDAYARALESRKIEVARNGTRLHFSLPAPWTHCEARATAAASRAKVVCGAAPRHVEALFGYVAEQLPTAKLGPADADFHWELYPRAADRRFGPALRRVALSSLGALVAAASRTEKFDALLGRFMDGVAAELALAFGDLEHVKLTGYATQRLELELSARVASQRSRALQHWVTASPAAAAPPDAFWHVPVDATFAGFAHGVDGKSLDPMKASLAELLEGVLSYQGTPRKLAVFAAELVRTLPIPSGRVTFASGPGQEPNPKPAGKGLDAREASRIRAEIGWHILTVEGEADRQRAYVDTVAQAFRDPVLSEQLGRLLGSAGVSAPLTVRTRPTKGVAPTRNAKTLEVTLPAREFDPRSGEFSPTRAPGVKLYAVVLGASGETRIGFGSDERELVRRLTDWDRAQTGRTLLDREGLSDLRGRRALIAGFLTDADVQSAARLPPIVYYVVPDAGGHAISGRVLLPAPAAGALWLGWTKQAASDAATTGPPAGPSDF